MKDQNYIKVKDFIVLLLIISVGAILRGYKILDESLWLDELITVNGAGSHVKLIDIYNVLHFWDQSPPLFDVLIHFYFKVFGMNDFTARLFPLLIGLFGLLSIYFSTLIMIPSRSIALMASIIVCFSTYHIYFSREVRPYILAFVFASISISTFYKLLTSNKTVYHIFYSICTSLLLYTSYTGVFIYFAQIGFLFVWSFAFHKLDFFDFFKTKILWIVLVIILYLPWIYPFIRVMTMWNEKNGIPTFDFFIHMWGNFFGFNFTISLISIVVIFTICLHGIFILKSKLSMYLFFMLFISFGGMYVKSLIGRNVLSGFAYSYQMVLFPISIWLVLSIVVKLKKELRYIIIMNYCGFLLYLYLFFGSGLHKKASQDYRGLVVFLKSIIQKNDILVVRRIWDYNYYNLQNEFIPKGHNLDYYYLNNQLNSDLIKNEKQLILVQEYDDPKIDKFKNELIQEGFNVNLIKRHSIFTIYKFNNPESGM